VRYLKDLGIAYLIGALNRHETQIVMIDGQPALQVEIPRKAVPDFSPGLTDKFTVVVKVTDA
jgi:hypothetical protein